MWLSVDALTAIWSNIGDDSLMHMADITVRDKCLVLRAVVDARSSVFDKCRCHGTRVLRRASFILGFRWCVPRT